MTIVVLLKLYYVKVSVIGRYLKKNTHINAHIRLHIDSFTDSVKTTKTKYIQRVENNKKCNAIIMLCLSF